jgi:type IV pilus assembly protein PilW
VTGRTNCGRKTRQRGFSLIELMIALVVGLLVVAAAGTIFVTNSQTFRATQSLSRVQENARAAFELMARDLREAGGNPCNSSLLATNVLRQPLDAFWTDWDSGIRGYGTAAGFANPATQAFGTANGNRKSGTQALEIKLAVATGAHVTTQMSGKSSALTVDNTTGLAANDVAMVCDFELASIFQATGVGATSLQHASGSNCTDGFTDKSPCTGGPPSAGAWHRYSNDAMIAIPQAQRWYIGIKPGGTSLFRTTIRSNNGVLTGDTQEIVENVDTLGLSYLMTGGADYVDAGSVTDWKKVVAVRITIQMAGEDRVGVNGETITRTLSHVVTVRNHTL